jgi:erythromycin esterase-like protein
MAALLLAGIPPAGAADDHTVIEWIRGHAVRLQTPQAGHGFGDMQPLKKIIGKARVVALGDAAYGTREFSQLKHRMLEFLASEMGFSILSIAADMPEAYRLNDYVLTGAGDPAKLLRSMDVQAWNTQEVFEMIRWMRQFNQSGKGRVEFTGFGTGNIKVAMETVRDFIVRNHPAYASTLRQATAQAEAVSLAEGPAFGAATAFLPVEDVAGKRIHFSGYIKTAGVTRGKASLWLRIDDAAPLALDAKGNAGATGTTDWTRYQLDLTLRADARRISFGAIHSGDGTAWFDSLAIEVNGVPYKGKGSVDLQTSGNRFRVRPDSEVFRSGKPSLRMEYGTPDELIHVDPDYVFSGAQPPPDSNLAAASWKAVVERLESSRASYRVQMVTDREIERVIQNARIVMQHLEIQAKALTEGSAMAQNVQWILEQSPGAKMVLWGHNAQVAASGFGSGSMGVSLRKMLGEQMVVFGFFNRGSLEASLAGAGIPLFAIDLRAAPKSDLKVRESFDALLFVEKITAATARQ